MKITGAASQNHFDQIRLMGEFLELDEVEYEDNGTSRQCAGTGSGSTHPSPVNFFGLTGGMAMVYTGKVGQ